jgi:anti-anti-sigma factor
MSSPSVECTLWDGVPVAAIAGDVDAANAARVLYELSELVRNDAPGMVLDLSETRYLDSAGINLLFEVHSRLETRRQRLRIVAPDGAPLRRILSLSGVDGLVAIDADRESALATFAAAEA